MNLIPASYIPALPSSVLVGWQPITPGLPTEILSENGLTEYQKITSEQRKHEFLTARTLLRNMMLELGWDPAIWRLEKEPLGKPYLTNGKENRYVSFSHSQHTVFAALSKTVDLGIDSELTRRQVNPEIVRRILSENEWKVMGEDDPITLWTVKEAGVKCLGTGLRTNLKELEMTRTGEHTFTIQINQEPGMQAVSFHFEDHTLAIAYH